MITKKNENYYNESNSEKKLRIGISKNDIFRLKKNSLDCFWSVISIIYLNTIGKSVEGFLNGSWGNERLGCPDWMPALIRVLEKKWTREGIL